MQTILGAGGGIGIPLAKELKKTIPTEFALSAGTLRKLMIPTNYFPQI